MAAASPYFQELRRNEPRHRNFKRFTKALAGAPKHVRDEVIAEKTWAGATLLFEALKGVGGELSGSTRRRPRERSPQGCRLLPLSPGGRLRCLF